jgi:hypothetical protein
MVRINASEMDVFAEVIAAIHAKKAFATRNARLHCYSIALVRVSVS